MGRYDNVPEKLQSTLEKGTKNIKKAAKEVKVKAEELTESTEKKVKAVKKTVKSAAEKKSAPKKSEKAVLAKNLKERLTFEFNGEKLEAADILKKVEKDASAKCGAVTIKKLDVYLNANENTAYYVVNGEARPEYKVVL